MAEEKLEFVTETGEVETLLEAFGRGVGVSVSLIDSQGKTVLQANGSRLCENYHLRCQSTRDRCRSSHGDLVSATKEGGGRVIHTCCNGLLEAVEPITVDGSCIGYAVVSQFFTEAPDRTHFTEQAKAHGFDVNDYLGAVDEISVVSTSELDRLLSFLTGFARLASRLVIERREREQACDRIAGQEQLFRSITECATDAVVVVDSRGEIQLWNRAAEKIFGYKAYEAIGYTVWDLLIPERHREVFRAGFEELRRSGEVRAAGATTELVGIRRDRRELRLELSLSSMELEGDWCGLGLLRDVTARTESNQELKAAHAYLSTVIEIVGAAVFTVDSDLIITSVNKEFCEITGYSESDVLGKHCLTLEGEPCAKRCGLFDPERTEPLFRRQCSLKAKDGRRLHIMKNATKLRDENGAVTGGIESFTDVTNLVQAQREAEAAVIAKSQFLATMSHEIRTPLNAVIGMTELMLDGEKSPQRREELEIVRNSGELLLSIVNDILDLSKFESGDVELEAIEFDLRNRVADVGDFIAQKAFSKGVELAVMVHSEVPQWVVGDPNRLRQILLNLANNAVKFTENGEVEIRIECESLSEGQAALKFRVMDTGIGIPPDRFDRLFKPFSQIDASTTRKYGGTGLGLAICKSLVEAMGGEIGCANRVEQGSEFWFTVSLGIADEQAPTAPVEHRSIASTRILVVDDNELNRRILREVLTNWGCRTVEVSSGPEALDLLANDSDFGAAILDYQMPEMNGADLAERMKSIPELQSIPLLMLTSMPSRGDAEAMREAGLEAYLTKPIRQSALLDALVTVVHGAAEVDECGVLVTRHSIAERGLRGGRILLVEDNVVNQKVATKMLAKLGHDCDIANNGHEAVAAVTERRYALVLMDCQMPEMDGYQATAEIRRREGATGAHIPIVAMTAEAMQGERERCVDVGMDDYISKPVAIDLLEAALDRYLRLPDEEAHSLPLIDFKRLRASACDDEEFERELVGLFLDELAGNVARIQQSHASGDVAALRREAHSLKGASGNVGAAALGEAGRALEMAARDDDLHACDALLDQLVETAETTRGALCELR